MLIDQFLPRFDAVESHMTIVRAPADRVWAAIRTADFGSNGIVRATAVGSGPAEIGLIPWLQNGRLRG